VKDAFNAPDREGYSLPRLEDEALLGGQGRFIDAIDSVAARTATAGPSTEMPPLT